MGDVMKDLGQYLRTTREALGLSMKDVYEKTKISDSRLSKLENNLYDEPSPLMLKSLAEFYSISVVDLFIRANYLTYDSLNICIQIFNGIDKLTDEDRKHIQGQIDYIISKQK